MLLTIFMYLLILYSVFIVKSNNIKVLYLEYRHYILIIKKVTAVMLNSFIPEIIIIDPIPKN